MSEAGDDGVAVPFDGETLSQAPPVDEVATAVNESVAPPRFDKVTV